MSEPTGGELAAGCGCLVVIVLLCAIAFGWAAAVGYALANGLFQ